MPKGRLSLIAINVLVFLFELSLGANLATFFRTYGAVPREILTGQDIPPAPESEVPRPDAGPDPCRGLCVRGERCAVDKNGVADCVPLQGR